MLCCYMSNINSYAYIRHHDGKPSKNSHIIIPSFVMHFPYITKKNVSGSIHLREGYVYCKGHREPKSCIGGKLILVSFQPHMLPPPPPLPHTHTSWWQRAIVIVRRSVFLEFKIHSLITYQSRFHLKKKRLHYCSCEGEGSLLPKI